MPVVRGNARSVHEKFKFLVEVEDIQSAAFQKCSELSVDIAEITYWEGGSLIPVKDAGRMTFTDVTLERGVGSDLGFHSWLLQTANAARATGLAGDGMGHGLGNPAYKRNLTIVQLDRDNSRLREWALYGAWPKKFVGGDWDNTADEAVLETLTFGYDYFQLNSLDAGAG